MKKQTIKKLCKVCNKEHYDNMSCIVNDTKTSISAHTRKHKKNPYPSWVRLHQRSIKGIWKQREELEVQKTIELFFKTRKSLREKDRLRVMELYNKYSLKDLDSFTKSYKDQSGDKYKEFDKMEVQGKSPTIFEYIQSSNLSENYGRYNDAYWLKRKVLRAKKDIKEKRALEFISKFPPTSYGMDYPPIESKIEEIINRQLDKIPEKFQDDYDPGWAVVVDIMYQADITESMDIELPYIYYKQDKLEDIDRGETRFKKSDIPAHPYAKFSRQRVMELADTVKQTLKEMGLGISPTEFKELKSKFKQYTT